MTFKPENPTMEIHTTGKPHDVTELLEYTGNCRQDLNQELSLHLPCDTWCSEQQKLRHVLDWAHRFLSSGSEVCHELCRADSLILDNEKKETQKGLLTCKNQSEANSHCQVPCPVGTHDVLEKGSTLKVGQPSNYKNTEQNNFLKSPSQEDLLTSHSITHGIDEAVWIKSQEIDNMKDMNLQQTTAKPTTSQEYKRTDRPQRYQAKSDSNTNKTLASDAATCLMKESTSCLATVKGEKSNMYSDVTTLKSFLQSRDSADVIYKGRVKAEPETTGARLEGTDGHVHKEKYSSSPEEVPGKTANQLKFSPTLTVYEQYQLFVNQLYHIRQNQHMKLGGSLESCANEKKTAKEQAASVEASAPPTCCFGWNSRNLDSKKQLNKAKSRRVTAAEATKKWCVGATNENQCRTSFSASRPQPAANNTEKLRSKKRTLEDRVKHTSSHMDTHLCLQSTETHITHHDNTGRPISPASKLQYIFSHTYCLKIHF